MEEGLNKLKQFESTLKAYFLQEFGKYLPEDKISLLNAKNYAEANYNINLSDSEMRGNVTRSMLRDSINVECVKEVQLNEGVNLSINYGQSLENALIEYYTRNLSQKYGFNVNDIPELAGDLEIIRLLNQKLDSSFDSTVFNSDAVKLLEAANVKEIIEKYDKDAIKEYLEKNKKVASQVGQIDDKNAENELMKESTDRENSVQIVWLDGKKYIKYINQDGNVSLTEVLDNGQIEEFYKRKLAELKPGEKLDPEKFKQELSALTNDTNLTKTEDVETEYLNHKEVNMLHFIEANEQIKQEAKKDVVTHNNDMNIHVIESTDDIVVTEDKDYSVDAHIIKNGEAQAEREAMQNMQDISSRVLSKEEYKELIDRFSKGENLTMEELESLKRTSQYFIDNGETIDDVMQESGAVLSPYNKNKNANYGFSISNFITVLVCAGAICTLIMSIYLVLFYR